MKFDSVILRFFRDEMQGILITDRSGQVVYADGKSSLVNLEKSNWNIACPRPGKDQKDEVWDLSDKETGKTYMVTSSTFVEGEELLQIHHLLENSHYTELYRDINDYSRTLKDEKEHDSMTGLYNKGKFLSLKESLFKKQKSIALFNMDLNFLKQTNDVYGHEAGDRLICKAAESLHKIEARNVMAFRMGGDEFLVVAIHITREQTQELREKWEAGLEELNRADDGLPCVIACGMVFGEEGEDFDTLFAEADKLMYEDKKAKKQKENGNHLSV